MHLITSQNCNEFFLNNLQRKKRNTFNQCYFLGTYTEIEFQKQSQHLRGTLSYTNEIQNIYCLDLEVYCTSLQVYKFKSLFKQIFRHSIATDLSSTVIIALCFSSTAWTFSPLSIVLLFMGKLENVVSEILLSLRSSGCRGCFLPFPLCDYFKGTNRYF